jgi:hypothetical protein
VAFLIYGKNFPITGLPALDGADEMPLAGLPREGCTDRLCLCLSKRQGWLVWIAMKWPLERCESAVSRHEFCYLKALASPPWTHQYSR